MSLIQNILLNFIILIKIIFYAQVNNLMTLEIYLQLSQSLSNKTILRGDVFNNWTNKST